MILSSDSMSLIRNSETCYNSKLKSLLSHFHVTLIFKNDKKQRHKHNRAVCVNIALHVFHVFQAFDLFLTSAFFIAEFLERN